MKVCVNHEDRQAVIDHNGKLLCGKCGQVALLLTPQGGSLPWQPKTVVTATP